MAVTPQPTAMQGAEAPPPGQPLVSVGLAVYNGEEYLRQAVDSILAQTYTRFELIISDNASTDGTGGICREYADRDGRVKYHRNEKNIGGANNENQTFRMSSGKYFRWAAHDDVLAPTLIERCVEVLEADESIVLCHTQIVVINESGEETERIARNRGSSRDPAKRFWAVAMAKDYCEETYGLMRSETLGRTRLQLNYTASDRTLMAEMALYGRFHEVPEPLFFKRMHEANRYVDWRTRMAWFDPANEGRIFFPFWTQLWDYLVTIRRSKASPWVQAKCAGVIVGPWLFGHGKNLVKDLAVAGYMRLHSEEWRKRRYQDTHNWT